MVMAESPQQDTATGAHQPYSRVAGLSDADSDAAELEHDIAKFNVSVRAFLATHHGASSQSGAAEVSASRNVTRGPRKAAEPRGDIKARLSKANRAFMRGEYPLARDLIFEIIRINAETHQAWTTLASIFREEGHVDKALMSMVYAAHLRPKSASEWLKCAAFALDIAEEHADVALSTARLCYSAAIAADPRSLDARVGRGVVCHRLGLVSLAIADYKTVLASRPMDLEVIRRLAEACMDNKNTASATSAVSTAVDAYDSFVQHVEEKSTARDEEISWYDIGIYTELLASAGKHAEAIAKLKSQSRRLLGRQDETFWDGWVADDREWDEDEYRRVAVPEYQDGQSEKASYGHGLPADLRLRLATYRLALGDVNECLAHLRYVDPTKPETQEQVAGFPFLVRDLAGNLLAYNLIPEARDYYNLLRGLPGGPDALSLLQMGRCHLAIQDASAAEECFLAAIETDASNIEARIELANLYSAANEREEALILVTEAMALRDTQQGFQGGGPLANDASDAHGSPVNRDSGIPRPKLIPGKSSGGSLAVIPRRYRPKRLVDPVKRRQNEMERARRLSLQYLTVQNFKSQIKSGRVDLTPAWMAAAKELIDEFRSYRKFYAWDKYVKFLGRTKREAQAGHDHAGQGSDLDAIAERLSRVVDQPISDGGGRVAVNLPDHQDYQGISFGNWLDLFLDYAISLAISGQYEESYRVCEAAKDCTVFTASNEYTFLIYVTWGACAVHAGDEETCVSIARQVMRDHSPSSDSYRMFSLLCRLCQTPASWYSSGPAQKFILRQIKAMDNSLSSSNDQSGSGALDVGLLVLYGHILFMSTSYVYALHYFLRARSRDPANPIILLSLGLGYIHYGLKRQSLNRQYLIMQGLGFMTDYHRVLKEAGQLEEACYGLGRTYQLIGLQQLALDQYQSVLQQSTWDSESITMLQLATLYNSLISYLTSNSFILAKLIIQNLLF